MTQYKVVSSEVKKTGTSNKNGKAIPWTLYVLTLEGTDIKPGGFAKVEPGDMIVVKEVKNGDYTNYNYEKAEVGEVTAPDDGATAPVSAQPASTPTATGSGADPRALKLLVLVAEQIGVDKNQIMDILTGGN